MVDEMQRGKKMLNSIVIYTKVNSRTRKKNDERNK